MLYCNPIYRNPDINRKWLIDLYIVSLILFTTILLLIRYQHAHRWVEEKRVRWLTLIKHLICSSVTWYKVAPFERANLILDWHHYRINSVALRDSWQITFFLAWIFQGGHRWIWILKSRSEYCSAAVPCVTYEQIKRTWYLSTLLATMLIAQEPRTVAKRDQKICQFVPTEVIPWMSRRI
jgi:hypothetical protein